MNVGVVGCGAISGIYFENLAKFGVPVVACADLDFAKAEAAARTYGSGAPTEVGGPSVADHAPTKVGGPSGGASISAPTEVGGPSGRLRAMSVEELLANPEVELVINLTVPKAHYAVGIQALEAGKHVYNEKPLTVELDQGRRMMHLAKEKGLRVGCAPDTFLGAGIQTCKTLLDEGAIGALVGANAFMLCPGHESWHPSPEFYYEKGGGPMFDMGPYYLTALVSLLGGIRRVSGQTRTTFPTRTITSQPKAGKVVPVETPTHIAGLMEFESGAVASITTSFDVQRSILPCIEVYGSDGSMLVPDPNGFGGPVKVFRKGQPDWEEVPLRHSYAENSRGLGVWDIAEAVREGRPHKASGDMALHVLEAMHGFLASSDAGRFVEIEALKG